MAKQKDSLQHLTNLLRRMKKEQPKAYRGVCGLIRILAEPVKEKG